MSAHFTQLIGPSGDHALKAKISSPVETDSYFCPRIHLPLPFSLRGSDAM